MERQIILSLVSFILCFTSLFSQEVRTYDGSNNNLANPQWGAVSAPLERLIPADYTDKISTPAGVLRQNPRQISNALFAQDSPLSDPLGLSDFVWVFGQFIDHDLTLSEGGEEPAMIPVDFPDAHFNPGGLIPNVMIPMFRTKHIEGTGTDANNPREHFNEITAWLDGSAVYGSDAFRASWLRTFQDGKLKTSAGNLLPYNTLTGEFDGAVDVDAPHMADDVEIASRLFVAGDVRANENVLLISYHTVFVREHNRICDELKVAHPDWQDEEIYQHARKIVGGIIQTITFDEWLPAMGVHLDAYQGYKSDVNPNILNGFSAAAFRMGHTLLSGDILVMDEAGNERQEGPMKLRDAFFNPAALVENGGLEPFFRGMAAQVQQELDAKVVDDVRNFLFGPPGAGGLDLAAININRGRERGLPDFNSYRTALGLTPYSSFSQISDDPSAVEVLEATYATIDDIDAWVGMLAESHMPDALFGETVMEFLKLQFSAIRDGDRFYYEVDPSLSAEEITTIKSTRMRDVIMRNTGIKIMQENVFEAIHPQDICGFYGESARLRGLITNEFGSIVLNVEVAVTDQINDPIMNTIANGNFSIDDLNTCEDINVSLAKNDDYSNGISTLDMVLILKHILNIEPFNSPYKHIAADVNNSGSISASDLVAIRKIILGTETTFPNNASWRFIDANYNFLDSNPLDEAFPEIFTVSLSRDTDLNFVAVKIGDVNGSADHTSPIEEGLVANSSRAVGLTFTTTDMNLKEGETYTIPFEASSTTPILGYQFTMSYLNEALDFGSITSNTLKASNVAMNDGLIRVSWNDATAVATQALDFAITFTAREDGILSEVLDIQSQPTLAEAYNENLEIMDVRMDFNKITSVSDELVLYQNQPNPFKEATTISFELPEDETVHLTIYNVAGKVVETINGTFAKGFNMIPLQSSSWNTSGILYYQLNTSKGSVTKKMIVVE